MLTYDRNSIESIFDHSKYLIGNTLRDLVDDSRLKSRSGKGGLGQLVEELWFDYEVNNSPTPDFEEAGVELKTTPLKKLKSGELQIKERLVCNMIDYCAVVDEDFEHSHFYVKCKLMLIIFYLHIAKALPYDLEFIYSVLWKLNEKDLLIIKQDYETIINKIKVGKAHELSEGDTVYLGACRKGQKGDSPVVQPFSDEKANKRAFSLKPSYMRTVLSYVRESGKSAISNFDLGSDSLANKSAVSVEQLKAKSFEEIILDRFSPYFGQSCPEIFERYGLKYNIKNKSRYAVAANAMACSTLLDINDSEEFQKSGIRMKTVRMKHNGTLKESMSFENINFCEVMENDWIDSRLYEIFTNRFLFVVFKEVQGETNKVNDVEEPVFRLHKVFFWTMPSHDIDLAEEYWNNIKENIINKTTHVADNHFFRMSDDKLFHVRPKGVASSYKDATSTPFEEHTDKQCYWFNSSYVKEIIASAE